MEKKCVRERWALASYTDLKTQEADDDDDDEALSLSDLPLLHHSRKGEHDEKEKGSCRNNIETQEEFDFCSVSKEQEMCAADEVFFQGQILPLRNSVSSEKGLLQYSGNRSISRSESMDHCYSSGFVSSRSSSISSHQSSSSGSGSSATIGQRSCSKPKLPPPNQFHSHPSPSPRINFPSNRMIISSNHRKFSKKSSSVWNVLRLGVLTAPPEIVFQDPKTRFNNNNNNPNCTNFGSRNSSSSNSSSSSKNNKKKKSPRRGLLGAGCKCSADAVDAVASKLVIIKRSASESSDVQPVQIEEDNVRTKQQQTAKKQMSHHRTFEWLKQLSLEDSAAAHDNAEPS